VRPVEASAVDGLLTRLEDALKRLGEAETRAERFAARLAQVEHRLAQLMSPAGAAMPASTVPGQQSSATSLAPDVIVRARLQRAGFDDLARGIAEKHGVTIEEVCGRSRLAAIVAARQELLYAIRVSDPRRWSFTRIGRMWGMDHTSVIAGFRRHEARTATREAA
jgi:chromosomal replication initiation ATPase DnaA